MQVSTARSTRDALLATSREAEHEPADLLAHEGRAVQAVVRGPAGVCTAEGL